MSNLYSYSVASLSSSAADGGVVTLERFKIMKEYACFRVTVDEVAKDFAKYADLARTRTYEIWDTGKVDVLLVRIDAVRDWHSQLQVSCPAVLITDEEFAEMLGR
jgi:hypothetical protein